MFWRKKRPTPDQIMIAFYRRRVDELEEQLKIIQCYASDLEEAYRLLHGMKFRPRDRRVHGRREDARASEDGGANAGGGSGGAAPAPSDDMHVREAEQGADALCVGDLSSVGERR